jgi:hypothetical protein
LLDCCTEVCLFCLEWGELPGLRNNRGRGDIQPAFLIEPGCRVAPRSIVLLFPVSLQSGHQLSELDFATSLFPCFPGSLFSDLVGIGFPENVKWSVGVRRNKRACARSFFFDGSY